MKQVGRYTARVRPTPIFRAVSFFYGKAVPDLLFTNDVSTGFVSESKERSFLVATDDGIALPDNV